MALELYHKNHVLFALLLLSVFLFFFQLSSLSVFLFPFKKKKLADTLFSSSAFFLSVDFSFSFSRSLLPAPLTLPQQFHSPFSFLLSWFCGHARFVKSSGESHCGKFPARLLLCGNFTTQVSEDFDLSLYASTFHLQYELKAILLTFSFTVITFELLLFKFMIEVFMAHRQYLILLLF